MPDEVTPGWTSHQSYYAMEILEDARKTGRPVILLTGAGISVDSGFPLASELKEYFVQVNQFVSLEGFSNIRDYIEEAKWPSRHDLRVELMLKSQADNLSKVMPTAEREATQAALVAELRRNSPSLAFSLQEIFGQLDPNLWNQRDLEKTYHEALPLANCLGKRSPRNIAYRSLLAHLCDNNQTTIDACFDHFIRDRTPTTTHQFVYFLTRILRIPVIFTTNFDPLLEKAFAGEGLMPSVYEVHGEESIPSARLLLSQPLSIVKLHGGTHQMQTGFDLDDPLSPAAQSAFRELYRQLEASFGMPPLTLVIGYSGSDRRVMDIIASQVREWKKKSSSAPALPPELKDIGRPQILWISRERWQPELLASAVKTHPEIMQESTREGQDKRHYPVHLVRYRDGRLFLSEALQTLFRHFPIARSYYQSVNFVTHSVSGKDRSSENARHFDRDWRIALIHTASGGGSSSTLVNVAENLELSEGYRPIWIDLSEVAGVPALIDVISERLTKLDTRLQAVRRPPLLRTLLGSRDSMDNTFFSKEGRRHELETCAQWLRQALRRGKYLLALDSLDEFPGEHPALEAPAPSETPANPAEDDPAHSDGQTPTLEKKSSTEQRSLLRWLIAELANQPDLIGDSRIAIAYSTVPAAEEEKEGTSRPCPFELLARELKTSGHRSIFAPALKSSELSQTKWRTAFTDLASPPSEKKVGKAQLEKDKELQDSLSPEQWMKHQEDEKREKILRPFVYTVAILISTCCRRVRSEVLLCWCVGEYIGRLAPSPPQNTADGSSPASPEFNENTTAAESPPVLFGPGDDCEWRINGLIEKLKKRWIGSEPQEASSSGDSKELTTSRELLLFTDFRQELASLWNEPKSDGQHQNDRAIPALSELIRKFIQELSGHIPDGNTDFNLSTGGGRTWLYRTEGAYHWMHRDIRNGLYLAIRDAGIPKPESETQVRDTEGGAAIPTISPEEKNSENHLGNSAAIAMAHHVIALFCYDELYERSRDARAFLEYLFHRIAAIRMAIRDRNIPAGLDWATRLLISLGREKNALLTRVRLPGLMSLMTQLRSVLREAEDITESTLNSSGANDSTLEPMDLHEKANAQICDLLSILSEFLLASGHPHSSFSDGVSRLRRMLIYPPEEYSRLNICSSGLLRKLTANADIALKEIEELGPPEGEEGTGSRTPQSLQPSQSKLPMRASVMKNPIHPADLQVAIKKMALFRDLSYSCHDPLLSACAFPRVWHQERGSQEADWVEQMKSGTAVPLETQKNSPPSAPSGEQTSPELTQKSEQSPESPLDDGIATRELRLALCKKVYLGLIQIREQSFDFLSKLSAREEGDLESDFFGGAVRKMLEFRLLYRGEAWIDSSKVYLYEKTAEDRKGAFPAHSKLRRELDTFRKNCAAENSSFKDQMKEPFKASPGKSLESAELWGQRPLLRRSPRRQRHECYRLCLMARLEAADSLFVASPEKVVAHLLEEVGMRKWQKIRGWLEDAEAILNRTGGFAEQQAMAITRLTCAELLVRRAEILRWGEDEKSLPSTKIAYEQCLEEAFTILSTVESLMNEGRGENRWRFFYLLTRGRAHLLRAFIRKEETRRSALTDLHWAARHLVGALGNCGLWTDRHYVLRWWWKIWKEVARAMHSHSEDDYVRYIRRIRGVLGIRWATQSDVSRPAPDAFKP
jgi:NAD-dependent SIR2 family protein deacetylase